LRQRPTLTKAGHGKFQIPNDPFSISQQQRLWPGALTVRVLLCLLTPLLPAVAADKNGVSANAISLPSGPGSIEGLGESFEPSLNNGTARYGLSLELPPGTAGHTPTVRFSYDGGQGNGPLGFGWSLPLAHVQRQTDKGIPRYVDAPNGRDDDRDGQIDEADELDTFINDAKEELVPTAGGDYFCENEESFIRYRRVGEHWEGTLPNGTRMEFGVTDEGRVFDSATNHVFKWLLQRQTDTRGNTIVYSWQSFAGSTNRHQKFLKEIRYGPGAPPWTYSHFVAFTYEARSDWFEDGRGGFLVRTGQRLKEVAVGTQGVTPPGHALGDFNADGQPDALNRKYRLTYLDYAPGQTHWSLLREITQVGADGASTLPPARFNYSVCHPPATVSALNQFIGGTNEPLFAMDNANVDLVDLNGDALPDLLRTGAAGGAHIAYLNRGEGTNTAGKVIAWAGGQEISSADGLAWNVTLQSVNDVASLTDMNGDGLADLAYKSALGDVFFFANKGTLGWGNRQLMSPQDTPPPAPYGNANVRTADLDFDKRMDVIESISSGGGADYRIWFNLGNQRYARSLTVPQTAGFLFSLAGVHIADFNGDRVPDLLRIQPTALTITAGLGHGNFASPVTVPISDWTLDAPQIAKARLEDITGDGLVDLVIERAAPGQIWYWINKGNYTLDLRRMVTGLPGGLSATTRWADLNGDGATDLIYADSASTPKMFTVDLGRLLGTVPAPNTLTRIENGIGRVITMEYAASTRFALEDAVAGRGWTNRLPFPVTVVSRVITDDSLGHSYETLFRYYDGYYDPVEKEFRGFASAEQIDVGDATAPTLVTRSHFDTGRAFETMKGKLLRLTTEQEDGKVFWDEVTSWITAPRVLHTGTNGQAVKFVHPTGKTKVIQELGQGTPRQLETEFAYDDYGNQTFEANYGIVEGANRSAFDDERITSTQFALNVNAWIIHAPSRQDISDEAGVVISRTETFYDDETFSGNNGGQVPVGNVTMRREYIDPANPNAFIASARTRYDGYGNPIAQLDPLSVVPGNPGDGHFRELTYDPQFHTHTAQETIHVGGGKPALMMQADYDPGFATMLAARDFNSHETSYGYDAFARLVRVVKPGDTAAYPTTEYDYVLAQPAGVGRIVNYTETRALDKTPGSAGAKRDHYFISREFMDGLGRRLMIRKEASSDATQPRVAVSGATLFNARQKPSRVLNTFFASGGGNLEALLGFEDVTQTAWQGTFHHLGELISLNLAAAHPTRTTYDATEREIEKTNPDGSFARTFFEPLIAQHFDENDTAPGSPHAGTPKVLHQDGLGRQIRTDELVRLSDDGTASEGLNTWSTYFDYDLNDELIKTTDSQGNVKLMAYDGLKRLAWMNDLDRGASTNFYDAASNVIETRDAKGQRITCTYDGANRLLTEDYHDEGKPFSAGHLYVPGQPVSAMNRPDVAYFYDIPISGLDLGNGSTGTAHNTKGMLAYVWDLSGEEHRSYDARRRDEYTVKRVLDPVNGKLVSYQTQQEYDSMDRLVGLVYPDNDAITYHFNDRNLLREISGGPSGTILSGVDYLPTEQIRRMTYGNGVATTYSYDARLRLSSLRTAAETSPNQPHVALDYQFDGKSNIETILDQRPGSIAPAGSPRRNTQRFDYDELYRVTRVRYGFGLSTDAVVNDGTIDYRYDRIGNLLSQTSNIEHTENGHSVTHLGTLGYGGSAGTFARTGRNTPEPGPHALSQLSTQTNPEPRLYSYDATGNITQMDGATNTWDFKDRLVSVEDAVMRAAYRYDYKHRRITKTVASKPGTNAALNPQVSRVIYVSPSFEVRPPEQPTKYIWSGPTRFAKVTGSLSGNVRIQRLRLAAGWNLVSLAVSASNLRAQLPQAAAPGSSLPVVEAAYKWNGATQTFSALQAGEDAAAGTVLWLRAASAGTVSVQGTHVDPTLWPVPTQPGFVLCPGFEPLLLSATLPANLVAWTFDASTQNWQSQLPDLLAATSTLPPYLAPGEALFLKTDGPIDLVEPDFSLRVRYYHQDHLGSSSVITDAAGQLVEETAYYPFGAVRHAFQPRTAKEAYGFTQKELDAESGLQYFEARYLAGHVGRFVSVDPLYAAPSEMEAQRLQSLLDNPQDLNLYAYARNNPVLYKDPTGCGLELDVPEQKPNGLKPSDGKTPTVLSGHGYYGSTDAIQKTDQGYKLRKGVKLDPGYTVVPEGTSITFYSNHGDMITDELGGAIELQQISDKQWRVTYYPGAKVPNYALIPPDANPPPRDLVTFSRPGINLIQVERPTSLKQLLRPGMGPVHWAACREAKGVEGNTVDEVGVVRE
jgi:RHS repeat-associated protein